MQILKEFKVSAKGFTSSESYIGNPLIGLTPLIALIYISVEPAVTQNCVPLLQTKVMYSYITILSVFLIMGTFGEKYVHSFLANPCISEKPNVYKFDSLYQPLTLYYPQLYSTNGFLFRLYQTFKQKILSSKV